jgi:hypothetical protein
VNWVNPRGADLGSYEERYRLTGWATLGLAISLLVIGLGFTLHSPVIFLTAGFVLAALTVQGAGLIDLVRRRIAFRADRTGITLGAVPDKLTVRRGSPLFIPWEDVESIVIYPHPRGPTSYRHVRCIGIQRRPGAEPLLWGNEQAPGCPVPGVATWATRKISGWRLDPDALAAATTAIAPGTRIIDTSADSDPAESGQGSSVPWAEPTD